MLRFILFTSALIICVYLMFQENQTISITAFGYEVTLSIALFALMILFVYYAWHLFKQPFIWLFKMPERRTHKRQLKKENFLTFVLQTLLDGNTDSVNTILNQKQGLLAKDDIKHLLLLALFKPSTEVFEKLAEHKETALAGWRGLLNEALAKGNTVRAEKILSLAKEAYPKVEWILTEQMRLDVLQNDWAGVLETLEALKKAKRITKQEYNEQRAIALFKLGRVDEAFEWDRANPAIAIAYAKAEPKKAAAILEKAWAQNPCRDIYVAYRALFENETPARRLKAIEKLITPNPAAKQSLIALSKTAMDSQMWGVAKEHLEVYIQSYPLTADVAMMMAEVERNGWHHEEGAKAWKEKAKTALPTADGWICTACGQTTGEWDAACPKCNAFASIAAQ